MSTFYLVLVWAGLGLLIGALALGAHLKPPTWGRPGRAWLLLLGVGSALLGGLLGSLLLSRLFGTSAALWIAVLATCAPWLIGRLRTRLAHKSQA